MTTDVYHFSASGFVLLTGQPVMAFEQLPIVVTQGLFGVRHDSAQRQDRLGEGAGLVGQLGLSGFELRVEIGEGQGWHGVESFKGLVCGSPLRGFVLREATGVVDGCLQDAA